MGFGPGAVTAPGPHECSCSQSPASSNVAMPGSIRARAQPLAGCTSQGGRLATITMKELLEAGVHFGHQTRRWNPKMKEYIFGERTGIHIIDLQKPLKLFREAARFVSEQSGNGKTILFLGTKRQAQESVAEEANRCGMFYVNHRW